MLRLLVSNSYVQFAGKVYRQAKGIPMGINPAVFLANYYLFYFEYQFLEQFGSVFEQYPPALEQVPAAQQWLTTTDLQEAPPAGLRGTVAKLVLDAFEFTGRFVDDFTSGPNRFLDKLWYDCDSILGDLIKGIYPGGEDGLTLECVPGAPHAYPTLDVCITTDADEYGRVQSFTELYDKRREPCYKGIPMVHYVHVSSRVSARVGPNILRGQLHRFSRIIMRRDNFVQESVNCVRALLERGYHQRVIFKVLRHFLYDNFYLYGDSRRSALWEAVSEVFAAGQGAENAP
jgi:hypothetical protein